jgi:putative membrane protein
MAHRTHAGALLVFALVLVLQLHAKLALACADHASGDATQALLASSQAQRWSYDPWVIATLAASAASYAFGLRRLWRHAGRGHGIRPWYALAFVAGWLSLIAALLSPLDALSDVLFSAHMTQHELLMLLAAPLLVLGRPWLALLWALPALPRKRVLAVVLAPRARPVWRVASHPALVLVLHGAALWLWHVPVLFQAALESEAVHAVQHASFFFTAALFFWALIDGRYGRAGYGASVFFVFLTALHSGVLGALLTVAPGLWYPIHAARTSFWQICALGDQQLAGLIMWVPAGVALLVVGLALFAGWLREAERRSDRAQRSRTLALERKRVP